MLEGILNLLNFNEIKYFLWTFDQRKETTVAPLVQLAIEFPHFTRSAHE